MDPARTRQRRIIENNSSNRWRLALNPGESSNGMVPRRGLEPPRPFDHWHLKPARLPIPPPGQVSKGAELYWRLPALSTRQSDRRYRAQTIEHWTNFSSIAASLGQLADQGPMIVYSVCNADLRPSATEHRGSLRA